MLSLFFVLDPDMNAIDNRNRFTSPMDDIKSEIRGSHCIQELEPVRKPRDVFERVSTVHVIMYLVFGLVVYQYGASRTTGTLSPKREKLEVVSGLLKLRYSRVEAMYLYR